MIDVTVSQGALDLRQLAVQQVSAQSGAVVTFYGVVRNQNLNRPVVALDYDCAPELAKAMLRTIAKEAQDRWGTETLVIQHGYGYIATGQVSVFILVATPKRDAAYEASRYIIEETKKRVPVWKREVYADREALWLEGTPLLESL